MRLSIVELCTVPAGGTEAEALADSIELARHADALGFERMWFAEHHSTTTFASHNPEVMIPVAAAATSGLRVGSGGVLLNHYSPFKVAEVFKQLHAIFPGRIDVGVGRATGGPVIDAALRRDRASQPVDDHREQVSELAAWLAGAFPAGHPFAEHQPVMPSVAGAPELWVLGSRSGGALAAQLGLRHTFAGFINPEAAAPALRQYRESFRPTGLGPERPAAMLGVNVTVADTDEEAERLAATPKGYYARLARGQFTGAVPTPETAEREMSAAQREEPTVIVDGRWPRFVAGSPQRVRHTLDEMTAASAADELIIQDMIADPGDRRRSYELLAELYDLTPRAATAVEADAVS